MEPFVTIFPASDYFRRWFDPRLLREFYEILESISSQVQFEIIDFYASPHFETEDFADIDHLNRNGAAKATALIEAKIKNRLALIR